MLLLVIVTVNSVGQQALDRTMSDTIKRVSPDTVQLNHIIEQQREILKALKPK